MSKESSSSSGIGFTGLLTIVFIVLKLIGKISWSWWWVLSPLWIGASVYVAVLAVCGLIILAAHRSEKKRVQSFSVFNRR